jgi:hypothetical protein
MTDQPSLFGPRDGATFDETRDTDRLNAQARRVFTAMADGQWHTLADLETRLGDPQASISARLRDLRKPRFGSHIVEREYAGAGLWRYRMPRSAERGAA